MPHLPCFIILIKLCYIHFQATLDLSNISAAVSINSQSKSQWAAKLDYYIQTCKWFLTLLSELWLPVLALNITWEAHPKIVLFLHISLFIDLAICGLVVLSNCHFVNMPFCELVILSRCHFVKMPFWPTVICLT
jgi:hypothetical protein